MKKILLLLVIMVLFSFNAMAIHTSHNVTAVTTITGTWDTGNETSLWVKGDAGINNTYNVSEVNGIPGFEVRFNISNVSAESGGYQANMFVNYDGPTAHIIKLEVYNFTGSDWEEIDDIDGVGYAWFNSSFKSQDYISTNEIWLRLYHYSSGNPTDALAVDFLQITEIHLPPIEEIFKPAVCPTDDTPTAHMFIFIGVLFMAMFVIGLTIATMPIFNMITGIGMIFYSFPLWGCNMIYGAVVTVFGIMIAIEAVVRWRTG